MMESFDGKVDEVYGPGPKRPAPWSTELEKIAKGLEIASPAFTSLDTAPKFVEGVKFDGGKIRWDLMPYGPLEEVAKLYTFGAVKYEPWNWRKGLAYSRCFAALMRHLVDWYWNKKAKDEESGCHPLAAVVFYCLNFMQYEMDQRKCDDRYIPEVQP